MSIITVIYSEHIDAASSNGCKLTQGIENIDLSLSHSGFHIQFSPQFWSTRLEQTLSAKLPVVESLIQVLTSHSTVAPFIIIPLFKIINACCGSAINARKDVFAKARCHISPQLFARMDLIKGRGISLNSWLKLCQVLEVLKQILSSSKWNHSQWQVTMKGLEIGFPSFRLQLLNSTYCNSHINVYSRR